MKKFDSEKVRRGIWVQSRLRGSGVQECFDFLGLELRLGLEIHVRARHVWGLSQALRLQLVLKIHFRV